jgi:hypothetical protein
MLASFVFGWWEGTNEEMYDPFDEPIPDDWDPDYGDPDYECWTQKDCLRHSDDCLLHGKNCEHVLPNAPDTGDLCLRPTHNHTVSILDPLRNLRRCTVDCEADEFRILHTQSCLFGGGKCTYDENEKECYLPYPHECRIEEEEYCKLDPHSGECDCTLDHDGENKQEVSLNPDADGVEHKKDDLTHATSDLNPETLSLNPADESASDKESCTSSSCSDQSDEPEDKDATTSEFKKPIGRAPKAKRHPRSLLADPSPKRSPSKKEKMDPGKIVAGDAGSVTLACGVKMHHDLMEDVKERSVKIPFDNDEISVGQDLTGDQLNSLFELLNDHRDCFTFPGDQLGHCNLYQHVINTNDALPIHRMPYPQSAAKRMEIQKQVADLLSQGIIRPSNSPWASAPHLVPKKGGEQRLVLDFRPLNSVTKRDSYPLPSIELCLNCLRGSRWFSCIDLMSGFHQIAMHPDDIEKTAFNTWDGFYEFVRMPFGLRNSPATFQRTMDVVLAQLKWKKLIVFLDDILIFSDTFEEHMVRLKECLSALKAAGLTIKPSKASFCLPGVSFLGHFVDESGIKMQPSKIEAVKNFPRPKTVKDVRSFLGLCSYYRRFVPKFADIARPLNCLLKKDAKGEWEQEHETAFTNLKRKLLQFPTLCHYDESLPIELHCDASGFGIGSVIGHRMPDGTFHPIQYASRSLSAAEKNYTVSEKECLSVVWSALKFDIYLGSKRFKVFTDHKSLEWLRSKEKLSPRLTRYALALQHLDMRIIYKSGRSNGDADALSRNPVSKPEDTENNLVMTLLALRKKKEQENTTPAPSDPQSKPGNTDMTILLTKVKAEQEKDEYFGPILKALREGNIRTRAMTKYTLRDDVLYRSSSGRDRQRTLLLCIPHSMQEDVLEAIHDSLFGCHFGVTKTMAKIRERFWFNRMEKFVRKYIRTCTSCQFLKTEKKARYGMLVPIKPEVDEPFYKVGIDIMGPFHRSKAGNKFVIVACCYFSRYVEMKAVPAGTSKQVAKFLLENVIRNHGFVSKLVSDRGTCFLSKVMKQFYEMCSIEKVNTTAYRPQTDGLVESFNKTLAQMISHYVDSDQRNWDKNLPIMQLAYNSSVSSATKTTPFLIVHSRNPRSPLDIELNLPSSQVSPSEIREAWKKAQQAIKQSQERSRRYYNKKRREPDFSVGDEVLRFNATPNRKLMNKLLFNFHPEIYTITANMGNNVYKVQAISHRTGKPKTVYVNVENLKHFHNRELYSDSEDSQDQDDILSLNGQESISSSSTDDEFRIANPELPCPPPSPEDDDDGSHDASDTDDDDTVSYHTAGHASDTDSGSTVTPIAADELQSARRVPRKHSLAVHQQAGASANKKVTISQRIMRSNERNKQKENADDHEESHASSGSESVNSNPAPRRSQRIKAKAKGRNFLLPLMLLSMITACTASFTKTAPLVWRITEKPVISGVTEVNVNVKFESPCFVFNDTLTSNFGNYTASLRSWCERIFDDSFLTRLSAFCNQPAKDGTTNAVIARERRGLVTAVIVGSLAVTAFSTIGISGFSAYQETGRNSRLDAVEERQMNMNVKTENIHAMINRTAAILFELEKSQRSIDEQVYGLKRRLIDFEEVTMKTITTVTALTSRLQITEERLIDTARDWKQGMLNLKFLDTFNISLPCKGSCPASLLKPQECFFDPLRKLITFSFVQRTVKRHAKILKADAFSLISRKTHEETCFLEYSGPDFVVYDTSTDCVTPLRGNLDTNENVILSPSVEYCTEASPLNSSERYWSKERCVSNDHISNEDIITIKSSNDHNFIFCYTLNVTVFNRTYPCPSFVFALPQYASFTIGKMTYTADQLKISNSLRIAPVHTTRVNFHLLPVLSSYDGPLNAAQTMTKELAAQIQNAHKLESHNSIPISHVQLVFTILIIILLVVVIRSLGINLSLRLKSSNPSHPFSEDVDNDGDSSNTENDLKESRPRHSRSSSSRSSSVSTKQTLLVAVVALTFAPSCTACPHTATVNISTSICPSVSENASMVILCNEMQEQSVARSLARLCTETTLRATSNNDPRQTTSFPLSQIPLQAIHLLTITGDWEKQTVSENLISSAGLDIICVADFYYPLHCLHDPVSRTASFVISMRKTITTPLFLMAPDFVRRLSLITCLAIIGSVSLGSILLYNVFLPDKKTGNEHTKSGYHFPDVIPHSDENCCCLHSNSNNGCSPFQTTAV